jgi:hemoglobin
MFRRSILPLAGLSVAVVMAGNIGCNQGTPPAPDASAAAAAVPTTMPSMPTKSLYERLGGDAAITAVVSDFVDKAAGDPAVNFTRQNVPGYIPWDPTPDNVATLKKHLTQFVEMAAGGPQTYEGRPNKEVHAGMQITDAEFKAIAADLKATLDKYNVPAEEEGELMAAVGGTYNDIVMVPKQ